PPHQRERAAEERRRRPPLQRAGPPPGSVHLLLGSLVRTGLGSAGVRALRTGRRLGALGIRVCHGGSSSPGPESPRHATSPERETATSCLPARELISATAYAATGTSGGRW